MLIKRAKKNNSRDIAILYKRIFDSSHLTSHYPEHLLGKYFTNLIELNEFCYVAVEKDKLLGFLIGGAKIREALKQFARENFFLIIYQMLRHPKFLVKALIQKLVKKNKVSAAKMRLFIIAVAADAGKKGVGSNLVSHFEREINDAGYVEYGLNVRSNNHSAQQFYFKRGFIQEFKSGDSLSLIKTNIRHD